MVFKVTNDTNQPNDVTGMLGSGNDVTTMLGRGNDVTTMLGSGNDVTTMLGRGNDDGFEITDDVIEGRSRKVQGNFYFKTNKTGLRPASRIVQ